jgi:hypothetical protein
MDRRSSLFRALGTAALLAAPVAPGLDGEARAAAPPGPAALTWDAPAACPAAEVVLGNVERIVAAPGRAQASVAATAHVLAAPDGSWQASLLLEIRGTRTERRFEAESCDALAAAAALIIALAVEVQEEPTEPPPLSAPAGDPSSPSSEGRRPELGSRRTDAEAPPSLRATGATSVPREDRSRLYVMTDGIIDWGTVPQSPAVGVEAGLGSRWRDGSRRGGVLGTVSFFPSHRLTSDSEAAGVYGDFWMVDVAGRGCLGLAVSRFEIGPCIGLELDAMHASSFGGGPTLLASSTQVWGALLGSVTASWNVSGTLEVLLRTDLAVPNLRRSWGLEYNDAEVYKVSSFSLRGALGIASSF